MPITICTTNGIFPVTHKPCEFFGSGGVCKLEDGVCVAKRTRFTDKEIASYEHIDLPDTLQEVRRSLSDNRTNPYQLFPETSFEAVRHALSLIDRVTPLYNRSPAEDADARAYIDNIEALETDALMLTSLFTTINALCAFADGQARQAEAERKVVTAQKASKIREAFANNVRVGTITEKGIEALTRSDTEVREVRQIALDADKRARILRAMTESIPEHVNMLKRRIDGLRQELRYTQA